MRNAHFGLKSTFAAITSVEALRGLVERFAPCVSVDWSQEKNAIDERLLEAIEGLRSAQNW